MTDKKDTPGYPDVMLRALDDIEKFELDFEIEDPSVQAEAKRIVGKLTAKMRSDRTSDDN